MLVRHFPRLVFLPIFFLPSTSASTHVTDADGQAATWSDTEDGENSLNPAAFNDLMEQGRLSLLEVESIGSIPTTPRSSTPRNGSGRTSTAGSDTPRDLGDGNDHAEAAVPAQGDTADINSTARQSPTASRRVSEAQSLDSLPPTPRALDSLPTTTGTDNAGHARDLEAADDDASMSSARPGSDTAGAMIHPDTPNEAQAEQPITVAQFRSMMELTRQLVNQRAEMRAAARHAQDSRHIADIRGRVVQLTADRANLNNITAEKESLKTKLREEDASCLRCRYPGKYEDACDCTDLCYGCCGAEGDWKGCCHDSNKCCMDSCCRCRGYSIHQCLCCSGLIFCNYVLGFFTAIFLDFYVFVPNFINEKKLTYTEKRAHEQQFLGANVRDHLRKDIPNNKLKVSDFTMRDPLQDPEEHEYDELVLKQNDPEAVMKHLEDNTSFSQAISNTTEVKHILILTVLVLLATYFIFGKRLQRMFKDCGRCTNRTFYPFCSCIVDCLNMLVDWLFGKNSNSSAHEGDENTLKNKYNIPTNTKDDDKDDNEIDRQSEVSSRIPEQSTRLKNPLKNLRDNVANKININKRNHEENERKAENEAAADNLKNALDYDDWGSDSGYDGSYGFVNSRNDLIASSSSRHNVAAQNMSGSRGASDGSGNVGRYLLATDDDASGRKLMKK